MKPPHLLLSLLCLTTALGCSDSANTIGPGNQLQVTNAADDFQWQVSNLDGVDQTLRYTWANTGDSASVNQATALTGGTATITIRDAAGTQVYTRSLTDNGTYQTALGTTGAWQITVRLSNAQGTINFRVQKAP